MAGAPRARCPGTAVGTGPAHSFGAGRSESRGGRPAERVATERFPGRLRTVPLGCAHQPWEHRWGTAVTAGLPPPARGVSGGWRRSRRARRGTAGAPATGATFLCPQSGSQLAWRSSTSPGSSPSSAPGSGRVRTCPAPGAEVLSAFQDWPRCHVSAPRESLPMVPSWGLTGPSSWRIPCRRGTGAAAPGAVALIPRWCSSAWWCPLP